MRSHLNHSHTLGILRLRRGFGASGRGGTACRGRRDARHLHLVGQVGGLR